MSKSIYKIIVSILFGIVFLLGGAGVAFGADEVVTGSGSYILKYKDTSVANYLNWAQNDVIEVRQPTMQGCQNAKTNALAGGSIEVVQDCVFVPGASGAATEQQLTAATLDSGPAELKNFKCGITDLKGCLPIGVYYVFYKPVSVVFIGTSYLFDIILDLSIKKEFVDRPFINSSWTVVRDFSNMIFIFILLYTGIMTMIGGKDWKRTVLYVILIALLINFSLFFTKVIIDAGNILAVGVSDAIRSGHPSISEGLVKNFEPQAFLEKTGTLTDAMDAIIIFIIAAIINGYAAYIFFKAALLFFGRLIAFWFLMIISPFAFISLTFPKGNKFQAWFDMILNQAFVAPVYLFLIYLILQVINVPEGILGGMNMSVVSGSFFFDKLITPIIMATLILFAMQQALKFAESMAGEFGKMGSKMSGSVLGLAGGAALGVATGGASMLARQTIGRGGAALGEGLGNKLIASDNALGRWAGRQSLALADKAKTSSFDVRQADGFIGKNINKGLNKGFGAFGVDTKKGMGALGAKSGKGGYIEGDKQRKQAKEDKEHEEAERVEMTDKEKEKLTGVAREKAKATTETVASKKKEEADLEKEVDTLRKSGRYEPKLADLSRVLGVAKKERQDAENVAKKATEELMEVESKVTAENERRRSQYAKDTSSWFSGKKAREERAQRIRGGRTQDERAKARERKTGAEKKKEDKAKTLKTLAEKKKKAEDEGNTAVVEHYEKEIEKAEKGD